MKLAIVGAMQEEIDLLKADISNLSEQTVGNRKFYFGNMYKKEVVLVFSRWGKVAAASTVTTCIDKFEVDIIIFSGVAGAVSPNLEIGDIIIASELLQYDLDASVLPEFEKFEVPLLGISRFKVNNSLVELAKDSALNYIQKCMYEEIDKKILDEFNIKLPKVVVGLIASGDQFIANQNVTKKLNKEIKDLLCIEMEGAAVAQVCYEHDIPFLVSRAISDKADHSAVINFPRFVKKVASYYSRGMIRNLIYNFTKQHLYKK